MYYKEEAYEYDMRKCNISILKELNIIDDNTYKELYDAPKMTREVKVGLMIKEDSSLYTKMKTSIEAFISRLKRLNDLEDKDIIEVANDAIWVRKQLLTTHLSDYVDFICKRKSTSVFSYGKIKFYYDSNTGEIFQRGLGNKDFIWYEDISSIMQLAENNEYKLLYEYIHGLKLRYVRKELDEKYYIPLIANKDNVLLLDELIKDFI